VVIYRVSIKDFYYFKIIYKTNAAYLETHTHTSRQKSFQSFVSDDPGNFCSCAPRLDATDFEKVYPTTEELKLFEVSEGRVCNSCAAYISQTVSHATAQLSEHLF
jgi:hypothetical protein